MRLFSRRLLAVAMMVVGLGVCGQAPAATTSAAKPAPDMSQGNPKAKVTVVEYASVACPICGRWFKEVYPAFKAKYIDTGKVHFVTREMLVGDDSEVAIASAGFLTARCAGKDNYYKVTDAIYASQPQLYDNPHDILLHIAQSVGMSEQQFNACVANTASVRALDARVESYVRNDHIQATPTFVINGKALEAGYHPLTDLDAAIAAAQSAK